MVKAWREQVTIPTYEVGAPEKNPIFLENRVYQGSSGVVYPYPVIERISDERVDKEYNAIYIENEYLKVMILPELGGRVQMAYDKVKQRHFVYYNHVIKPALVGLAGPWISGGIEFNWPQHHRPSTYMPVDATIEEHPDGSVTVWVNEMERMFHQKGMAGFTLRPGCAYLEIQGRLSNRSPLPQTFLWWANPAVEVGDHYQSVFPPDVNAVFDHGKRAVSSFPIATGTYYKMDYSAGVDISNYKNIPVPTSYMAVNSKYDFEGGYENDTQGGMLHVASHHFSPGKKQWTWGNGDFGRAWDRCLTDNDYEGAPGVFRPYIELMAGIYTENQPDFTWLMPYEEKQFVQYFMPYRDLGIVKQASKDFVMNIHEDGRLQVYATSKQEVEITVLTHHAKYLLRKTVTLSPEVLFDEVIDLQGHSINELSVYLSRPDVADPNRIHTMLAWQAEPDDIRPIPDAAEAALRPEDIKTIDQLYLTGLHLEQYRHATWSALDYYEEALRRDPLDYRCNNQVGLWYLRRGRFDKAEPYLRTAVKVLQRRNPNPYDGEPIYNLALCLKYQFRPYEAHELFWKATWNKAWADAAYFEAACISTGIRDFDGALDEVNRCLIHNSHNHKARALKATILRKLGKTDEALAWIHESYTIDPFNYGCMVEEHLLTGSNEPLQRLITLMHGEVCNYHELALDYAQARLFDEAVQVLTLPTVAEQLAQASPLTSYYLGYFLQGQGLIDEANAHFARAEHTDLRCCFPNRLEDVQVLTIAKRCPPQGARAPYLLGCLYYDKRQYHLAKENWELSAQRDAEFPTVWRNLALYYYNKEHNRELALEYMERAFRLDPTDSRILMELDQLYKVTGRPHAERLAHLEQYPALIAERDDLLLEQITLLNHLARYDEAMTLLDSHIFHPWEGGEGKVPAQYQYARVEKAKSLLADLPENTAESKIVNEPHASLDAYHSDLAVACDSSELHQAISLLTACLTYPHHLGEGKLQGAQDNDFYYLLGCAYHLLGDEAKARECWRLGTQGPTEPVAAIYYNDAKPDKIFYAALCYRCLGMEDKARSLFYKLINYGEKHFFDEVKMDYFAVSLPDLQIWNGDLNEKNRIHCFFMLALGYTGLSDTKRAQHYMGEVAKLDVNHQGVQALRTLI